MNISKNLVKHTESSRSKSTDKHTNKNLLSDIKMIDYPSTPRTK